MHSYWDVQQSNLLYFINVYVSWNTSVYCTATPLHDKQRPRRPPLFQTSSSTSYISWTERVNRHPQSITCYCSPAPRFCLNKSNVVSALYVCCALGASGAGAAAYNTGDVNVRCKEAAIFICGHSERFPKSIKAPLEGTGIAN